MPIQTSYETPLFRVIALEYLLSTSFQSMAVGRTGRIGSVVRQHAVPVRQPDCDFVSTQSQLMAGQSAQVLVLSKGFAM